MSEGFGPGHLPYGSVRRAPGAPPRLCVRLGDEAIELAALAGPDLTELTDAPNLDRLLAAPPERRAAVRDAVLTAVAAGAPPSARVPLDRAVCDLPFTVGDYVDFYSSLEHATNLGRMFRPGAEPLAENWRALPIGYHGRARTVVVSGTPVRRPRGHLPRREGAEYGPAEKLDFELELGFVTAGAANAMGEPVPIALAAERLFGVVLVNDWSARDIQRYETVPLGPFLGKSFATSISAWVTPLEALAERRVEPRRQDPPPASHLRGDGDWALDLDLGVQLNGETVSRGTAAGLYWTAAQQLTHAASNGAAIGPGDLLATGTISGATRGSEGSMIELSRDGAEPLEVGGQARSYLGDGDAVVMRARGGEVALGEVEGRVLPAT